MLVRFQGVFANLLSASAADGDAFDPGAQREYVEGVVEAGVHGVSASLSSGEFGYHTGAERAAVIACVARTIGGRVPVLAGVSELSLRDTVELARQAEACGADALMVMPRSYLPLTEDEVVACFGTLLEAVQVPLGVYNNPSATKIDIGAGLFQRIVALDPTRIVVAKDGSGQLFRTVDVLARCPGFAMLQGHARLMVGALLHGAPGTDFVMASLFPRRFVAIYAAAMAGDWAAARAEYDRMLPMFRLMERYDVTRLAKATAPRLGLSIGPHRRPVLPLPPEAGAEIDRALAELGEPRPSHRR